MTNQRAVATRPTQALEPDAVGRSLLLSLTHEQLEVIRKAIAPGISDVELKLFLRVAQENNVSPWTSPPEIWAVPRRSQIDGKWITKYTPTMGIDGWRKLLQRTGRVLDSVIEWCGMDGQWTDVWLDDTKPPAAARASIYVRGWERPQRFVCRFKEYAQYKDGGLTAMWKEKPAHMIGIRALSHCAKEVLRAVGGFRLGDIDGGEWEPTEIAPERVAQRRFWAIATDLGYDDTTVRRAFHLNENESLGEYVERMGGWGKAQSYIEAWGHSALSLPEPSNESANDLLYAPDEDERVPVGDGPVTSPFSDDRTPTVEPEGAGLEPAPDDGQQDDGADYLGVCAHEGCDLPATRYGRDAQSVYCDAHGDQVEQAEPVEPDGMPPMPDGLRTPADFLEAVRQAFALLPARVDALLGTDWRKAKPDALPDLWRTLYLAGVGAA